MKYTPQALRHEFYDSANQRKALDDGAFYDTLALEREPVRAYERDEPLSGYELIYADALHMALPAPIEVQNRLSPAARQDVRQYIHERTDATVTRLRALVGWQLSAAEHTPRTDVLPSGEADEALLAVRVLATIAHRGVFRRNRSPFIEHPIAVASILDAAWPRLPDGSFVAPSTLRRHKAVSYLHDAPEDTIAVDGKYLQQEIIASPLVIERLLGSYAFEGARRAARATFLLSHHEGIDGKKASYGGYAERGIELAGADFVVPKRADTKHNILDEDTVSTFKTHEKRKLRLEKYNRYSKLYDAVAEGFSPEERDAVLGIGKVSIEAANHRTSGLLPIHCDAPQPVM